MTPLVEGPLSSASVALLLLRASKVATADGPSRSAPPPRRCTRACGWVCAGDVEQDRLCRVTPWKGSPEDLLSGKRLPPGCSCPRSRTPPCSLDGGELQAATEWGHRVRKRLVLVAPARWRILVRRVSAMPPASHQGHVTIHTPRGPTLSCPIPRTRTRGMLKGFVGWLPPKSGSSSRPREAPVAGLGQGSYLSPPYYGRAIVVIRTEHGV